MAVLIGALLAVLVVGIILYPFYRWCFLSGTRPSQEEEKEPGRENAVYESIRTLRLEHDLGSIEEAEYLERLGAYRLEAAAALRDQEIELDLERRIEQEIAEERSNLPDRGPQRGAGPDAGESHQEEGSGG